MNAIIDKKEIVLTGLGKTRKLYGNNGIKYLLL
jgi:hypothetical protein